MKKVFIDTNVMLDLLLHREPFYKNAALIFSLADTKEILASVASISFSTASYFMQRFADFKTVSEHLRNFSSLVEIVEVNREIILKSISQNSLFSDIEDGIQYYAAKCANCDFIITRNPKDFSASEIPVLTPEEFLEK